MTTNSYFNQYNPTNEQELVEDMTIESIQIRGFDVYYIQGKEAKVDYLTGDTLGDYFDNSTPIEMYLESVDGFGGDTMLMSKFGLNIEDTATLVVSKKRFKEVMSINNIEYPMVGDLLYIPMTKSLLEIENVPTEEPFYQLGKTYVYKLRVSAFVYDHQNFTTGIDEVDQSMLNIDLDDDQTLENDEFGDNEENYEEVNTDGILDLSKDNPMLKK